MCRCVHTHACMQVHMNRCVVCICVSVEKDQRQTGLCTVQI